MEDTPCSCGLLPCICVMEYDDFHMMDVSAPNLSTNAASRLRRLVAANATAQCTSCMFLPCICPAEDEAADADESTSVEAASPLLSSPTEDDDSAADADTDDQPDALGRVRLPSSSSSSSHPSSSCSSESGEDHEIWIAREVKRHLRPHQIAGVRFMVENAANDQGCILADYMGLGKTLQVITVIYSFLTDRQLPANDADADADTPRARVMVLCPAICIPNWQSEFKKWLHADALARCPVLAFDAATSKGTASSRVRLLQKWKRDGGVLLMGYEMYRSLLNPTLSSTSEPTLQVCSRVGSATMEVTNAASAKLQKSAKEFYRLLCDPGADMVVLDEGHRLKDPTSLLCQSVAKIKSRRRLVLTGYPVQNSLSEYWCMVNFAREGFLGAYDEFRARYERPILEGNHERSRELIHKLKGVVLRRGKALLKKQLPPKREWILYCKLSPLQHQLYLDFLNYYGESSADLLTAYSALLQVMNHPDIIHQKLLPDAADAGADDDDENVDGSNAGDIEDGIGWAWESEEKILERRQQAAEQLRKRRQRILERMKSYEWARRTILGEDDTMDGGSSRRRKLPRSLPESPTVARGLAQPYHTMVLENSGKMAVLMEIIKESFAVGDKVIVFSQSVPTLKVITDFLLASSFNPKGTNADNKSKAATAPRRKLAPSRRDPAGLLRKKSLTKNETSVESKTQGQWFLQIDGATTGTKRMEYIQAFSSPTSTVQLLLVSTRAGAEGINLHAGNRLVLFDVSWNPSNDHQSMCRSHRIGQAKNVHVYRLVSTGTMERMIYEQQMKKVDLSTNVVDNQQNSNTLRPSGATSTAAGVSEDDAASTGFFHPPSQTVKPLEVDEALIKDDPVLLRVVVATRQWLVDVIPVRDEEEEGDAESEEGSEDSELE